MAVWFFLSKAERLFVAKRKAVARIPNFSCDNVFATRNFFDTKKDKYFIVA